MFHKDRKVFTSRQECNITEVIPVMLAIVGDMSKTVFVDIINYHDKSQISIYF